MDHNANIIVLQDVKEGLKDLSLKQTVLIVDEKPSGINAAVTKHTGYEALLADIVDQAIEHVNDPHLSIRGVFISSSLPQRGWLKIIGEFHRVRPGVPIFLITSSEKCSALEEFDQTDFSGLGVRSQVMRPINYASLIKLIEPLVLGSEADAAMIVSDLVKTSDAGEYTPIRADSFFSGSQSLFDIFIRISDEKFFKICSAGSKFDELRVSNYVQKGITHFHLKKEAQQSFLKYCEFMTQKVLASNLPVTDKVAQTGNLGEQTLKFLSEYGLGEQEIKFASSFSKAVEDLFQQFRPSEQPVLKGFLNDLAGYEHGVAVAMLSGLLSMKMDSGEGEIENLGLAALLHDFALVGGSETIRSEDESKMSLKEKTIYRKHPEIGAKYMAQIRGITPSVVRAVHHHHVRQNQMGFPVSIPFSEVGMNAQIIGISDEFLRLMLMSRTDSNIDPFAQIAEQCFSGFSEKIVQGFKATFKQSF